MIDWIEVIIPITHKKIINGGFVDSVNDSGELEWRKVKPARAKGSWDSTINVKSEGCNADGLPDHLFISGNPAKFLQGHNLFGMDDPVKLATSMAARVCEYLGFKVTIFHLNRWFSGDMWFKRLDITFMYDVENQTRAMAFIHALEYKAKLRRRGRGEFKGNTLYFGKNSRRWAIKVYSKYQEITSKKKGHRLSDVFDPDIKTKLEEYADGSVRFELVLRSLELKESNLDYGKWWTPYTVAMIFEQYLEKLDMVESAILPEEVAHNLPNALMNAYLLWKQGVDLKQTMTKPTFYRQRKQLLEHGIDIALKCPDPEKTSNVVPIRTVIEAKPMVVPEWAKGTDLYYEVK